MEELDVMRDAKGRIDPNEMSPEAMLRELVLSQRLVADTVTDFIEQMKKNPMMKAFIK